MSDTPYGRKPNTVSEPNEWHQLSFKISIDQAVDWDEVDLRKWAQTVAKYTALLMAKSTLDADEFTDVDVIKTLILGVKAERVKFVTDTELHNLIDDYEE